MKTVGFPQSHKENEKRRAIVPEHIKLIKNTDKMYFEYGYGEVIGIPDSEYTKLGCKVCSRDECLRQDVICDPKIGDAEYLGNLIEGQSIFGWIHATQNYDIAQKIIDSRLTAYAWENMFDSGRHIFWRNNELAGEAAVMHAFQCYGMMPYEANVAVIGKGNTARGAMKVLNMLGAKVMQYDRHTEALFRRELSNYDVIVNCVLWDVERKDHIIYKDDLTLMKNNAMIIDVSCDKNGGIETSVPTTIDNPIYYINGILHYAVDHTPALFYKTFTYENSGVIYSYIDSLINEKENSILEKSIIIKNGIVIDEEIIKFQGR